jgi:hypothetical protein
MVLVTAFVAAASVIGLALLSSTALQSAATRNHDLVIQADGLAESGINLGLYWVQNLGDSAKCPSAVADLKVGESVELKDRTVKGVAGAFDVSATRLSYNRYQLAATGKASAPAAAAGTPSAGADGVVRRTLTAQVDANYFGFAISATNLTTSGFTVPQSATIEGDIFSSVPVTIANGAKFSGTVYDAPATSGSGGGGLLGGLVGVVTNTLNAVVATLVPTPTSVNHYWPKYTLDGKEYAAEEITTGSLAAAPVLVNKPDTNPGAVFFHSGTLEVTGNVKINGTLIIKDGGSLRIQGSGNVITQPNGNLPALVVDGDIVFNGANASLEVNGLAYTGGRISRGSSTFTGCALNVNGTLLFGGTSGSLDANVPTRVAYHRVRASVPSLVTTAKPTPTSITVVYWKN